MSLLDGLANCHRMEMAYFDHPIGIIFLWLDEEEGAMKTIIVRGVDPILAGKMKEAADQENRSVNQLVLDILGEHFGMTKKRRFTKHHHDMGHLFGRWSEEEFRRIQGKIDGGRVIDPELWE